MQRFEVCSFAGYGIQKLNDSTSIKGRASLFIFRGKIIGKPSQILSALLLLSKYMLRNVAVIELCRATINNYITHGLKQCKVRISSTALLQILSYLGLRFMSSNEVISVHSEDLILEAFKKLKDNHSNSLPVVEGTKKQMR
uniref:SNF1-related protein kinase regulatory subunit gamma-1-like isoform X3 n=1 Tax=Fragaria vesca subsp. vesca TaxID=101020 RepID=UPI0005C9ECB5|nr:PREDICTED: SNF1-related protein kinase regulatory subunit gamma-1-like isoform X3 [Fragaria vesca subsp. vesca]